MLFYLQKFKIVFYFFLLLFVCNCQPRITNHGNFFNKEKINYIKKSKLNKAEIIEIFGAPSTTSTFSNNVWYYMSQVQSEKAYFKIKNISSKILKITFDKNKFVKKYSIVTEKNSYDITISPEKTVSSLQKDNTLIQEFFSIFIRKLETP
jgi:outer membrane protein assembly factor BamE (lipoprotein component of BamABCDE complex)